MKNRLKVFSSQQLRVTRAARIEIRAKGWALYNTPIARRVAGQWIWRTKIIAIPANANVNSNALHKIKVSQFRQMLLKREMKKKIEM
jgi:hypothetical protein